MASLTTFHYRSGNSVVHLLDTRFKLLLMAVISITVLNGSIQALMLITVMTIALLRISRVFILSAIWELRYFFVLLIMVFVARVLSTPGDPMVHFGAISISGQGLREGAVVCWRFLLVVCLGLIFVSTTRISGIKQAVAWFMGPIPWVPEKRVATMMGLLVRFIPVIFNRAGEVSLAQQARCVNNRKNPFYRLKMFSVPLIRDVFLDADHLAEAMESRCYSEKSPRRLIKASKKDWLVMITGCSLCIAALFL